MTTFLDTQKILLKFLLFFGFFTYDPLTLKVSTYRKIYCLIFDFLSFVQFSLVTLSYSNTFNEFLQVNSEVTHTIIIVEILTNLVTKLIIVICSYIRDEIQIEYLKAFYELEIKVQTLKIKFDFEAFYKSLALKCKIFTISCFTFYIILQITYTEILMTSESFIHRLTTLCYIIFSIHFSMLSFFIYFQLLALEKFGELIHLNLKFFTSHSTFYKNEIKEIYEMIFDIQDLIKLWSVANGPLAMGLFIFLFGVTSSEVFFVLVTAVYSNLIMKQKIYILYDIFNIIWIFPIAAMLILVTSSCDKVQERIEKIIMDLRNFIDDSDKVKGKMEKFLLQFYSEKQNFTAYDFFKVDRSLIYKVN